MQMLPLPSWTQLNGAGTLQELRLPREGLFTQAWPRDITAIEKGRTGLDEMCRLPEKRDRYQLSEDMKVGPLSASPSISGKS